MNIDLDAHSTGFCHFALRLLVVEKFADLAPMEAGSHGWIDCPHRRVVAVQIKTHIAKCLSFRKGNRGCAGLLTTPCATTTGNCRWWENSGVVPVACMVASIFRDSALYLFVIVCSWMLTGNAGRLSLGHVGSVQRTSGYIAACSYSRSPWTFNVPGVVVFHIFL